jgi:hypothetical protein
LEATLQYQSSQQKAQLPSPSPSPRYYGLFWWYYRPDHYTQWQGNSTGLLILLLRYIQWPMNCALRW